MDIRVTGSTKLFASVGDPVKHSISPEMHNSVFTAKNLNCLHIPMRVPKGQLADFIEAFRLNFSGLSVTKPHKQDIIYFLDYIDDDAKSLNAVNCIRIDDGKLYGYNTDGYGFSKSLEKNSINVRDKNIILAGVGGAAGVVANELLKGGCNLFLTNRTLDKAEELRGQLLSDRPDARVSVIDMDKMGSGYFGVINATPVGMYPLQDQCIFSPENVEGAEFAFDLIYNPAETLFLKMAKEKGVPKCINGFDMLFYQGIKAQEIWTGVELDDNICNQVRNQCEEYLHSL